jgi:formylglycine-generating enzyme required for sulfatase activity
VRSYLVHWMKVLGADPKFLIAKLEALAHESAPTTNAGPPRMEVILFDRITSVRRALYLALGEYQDLPARDRQRLVTTLLETYQKDPDAGIHGAVEWTLRQWQEEEKLAAVKLPRAEERGDRRWYVNSEGQTLAVIAGPVEFLMGSPDTEPMREPGEELHHQRIAWTFAIATKEVTRDQYERSLQANPANKGHYLGGDHVAGYSPDRQGPQVGACWYDAAAYCNWLSEKEHLEPCYDPNGQGRYAEGMKLAPDAWKRSGYRLPTETEWEYVCRAGAATSRYFGNSLDLHISYAWSVENSPRSQAAPCARLKPNDLGLFDLLGNAAEWCQDKEGTGGQAASLIINDIHTYFIRGGSYSRPAALLRSASHSGFRPHGHNMNNGFRLARTYP